MQNKIILDLETQKSFTEVGRQNLAQLKVSVAGIYHYSFNKYIAFEERELFQLEEILKSVDLVVGFNIKAFDFPVLQPYLSFALKNVSSLDIMEEIVDIIGHRVSLESIAQATLKEGKSGHGLEAIKLFKEGKIEDLKRYCLDDVRLTRKIYEYGEKHGYLSYTLKNKDEECMIPVKWG